MKVYYVSDGLHYSEHFVTKAEAIRAAKEASKESGAETTVETLTLVKLDRNMIIQLLNGSGGHVEHSELIATFTEGTRNK